jgi:D-serine dehydratase
MKTLVETNLIHPGAKGLGRLDASVSADEIGGLGWNLLHEDLSLPAAVLSEEKIAHNLAWMQSFVEKYGMQLAPHGKTTMAPKLFQRQIEAGAWGITLATAVQAQVAYEHGIRRVLMANELVGRQNMCIVSDLISDAGFEFFCLVDSSEQVEMLASFFGERGQRLNVLLELGAPGGRTGVRDTDQMNCALEALRSARTSISLCGLEVYEGVLGDEVGIRQFLARAVRVTAELAQQKRFDRNPIILSGAGSAWYDVVAEEFSKVEIPVDVVLRPGCYLTHDVGAYREAQDRILKKNPVAREMTPALTPALQLWAYVQSVPESTRAIIGLGKRDAAFDSGLPTPALHYRPGWTEPLPTPAGWKLVKLMDQHAYLEIRERSEIRVGDMLGFDISHPCLTFDKWRFISVIDSAYRVIDVVETFF